MTPFKKIETVLTSLLWTLSLSLFKDVGIVLGLNEKNYSNTTSSWDVCLPSNKVVGGEQINITEAPFILKLEAYKYLFFPELCGATVLSKEVAVTAAHCAWEAKTVKLISGITATEYGKVHDVQRVVIHEYFNPEVNADYDIALLFVKNPFIFSDYVQPIKLPTKELVGGTLVMVAGYGETKEKPLLNPPINSKDNDLRRTILPIVDRKTCNGVMKKKIKELYNETVENIIDEKLICAGYPGGKYDACQGDSGGPLYLNNTLYGVVSWGLGCAQECAPGIYTNIYKFLGWIKKTIKYNQGRQYL